MARCNDCNKFVSFDADADPEINDESPEVNDDGDGRVSIDPVEVRIVNNCAECGTEMREATLTVEIDPFTLPEQCPKCKKPLARGDDDEVALSCDVTAERNERYDGKGRYARHYYGVSVEAVLKCECGETLDTHSGSDEVRASDMDEC